MLVDPGQLRLQLDLGLGNEFDRELAQQGPGGTFPRHEGKGQCPNFTYSKKKQILYSSYKASCWTRLHINRSFSFPIPSLCHEHPININRLLIQSWFVFYRGWLMEKIPNGNHLVVFSPPMPRNTSELFVGKSSKGEPLGRGDSFTERSEEIIIVLMSRGNEFPYN